MQGSKRLHAPSSVGAGELTRKEIQLLHDSRQPRHVRDMWKGRLGEDIPIEGCRSEALPNEPVKDEAVEQRNRVDNRINRSKPPWRRRSHPGTPGRSRLCGSDFTVVPRLVHGRQSPCPPSMRDMALSKVPTERCPALRAASTW